MEKFPQLLQKYFIFVIKNKHFVTTRNISKNCHVKSAHKAHQIRLSNLVMQHMSTETTKTNNVKSGIMVKPVKNTSKSRRRSAFRLYLLQLCYKRVEIDKKLTKKKPLLWGAYFLYACLCRKQNVTWWDIVIASSKCKRI